MTVDAYAWERTLNARPHLPLVARALDLYLATYMDPERALLCNSPLDYPPPYPTEEEVRAEIPNSQGWFTAIEDSSYLTASLLWALARGTPDLATHDPATASQWADLGHRAFAGMRLLWSVPGNGFVCRGIVPGATAFYPNSSIDQFPNYLRGLWAWARSDKATAGERAQAAEVFRSCMGWLEGHRWTIQRWDGKPGIAGNIAVPHARHAPQFLALFLMAHDLTGEGRWMDAYRRFRAEDGRARLLCIEEDRHPHWGAGWDMQLFSEAVTVVRELDSTAETRQICAAGLSRMARMAMIVLNGYPLNAQLPYPPAVERRYDWREAHRRSLRDGLDLTVRSGQVLQGRLLESLRRADPDAPPPDGRAILIPPMNHLTTIALSGAHRDPKVDVGLRDTWTRTLRTVIARCEPSLPWSGALSLLNLYVALESGATRS